jgi:hypothetical protein
MADDPDNMDAIYSDADTITIMFSEATNQVPVATKADLDTMFAFGQSLGANYTGSWPAADALVITVADATGAAPPTIGSLTLTFQPGNGVKNAAVTSAESTGVSPVLAGDWGWQLVDLGTLMDTSINSASPTTNYGLSSTLTMNQGGGDLGNRRLLLLFDIGPIPVGATVSGAVLKLNKTGGDVGGIDVDVHRVTADWDSLEATWEERLSGSPWLVLGGDHDTPVLATTNVTTDAEYQWSDPALAALVDDWVHGVTSNQGLILGSRDTGSQDRIFASRFYSETSSRPRMAVTYTVP